ncbi:LLM class flavin-dependent oxidoreductase [Paenibacillus massiliensis]|uniref:LLM class flavin-dependent oxidoreductase n=1 Tax=Paenibacillus massiliensis TaxID=225917 RepID=UPI00056C04D5|nr:LLM class flavin-dependent oxidoreductase [Paenibacillus massiliensis]
MEFGLSTFLEAKPRQGGVTHAERLRQAVDEAVLAEQVGLDVYAIGEHHRVEYASSAPTTILAAIAAKTNRIRLSSAVSVLSSDDPVRVYQNFATLDGLSNGRAEIMAGRGSFIESFPLFGYTLDDYNELFEEKLDLLLNIVSSEKVTWSGNHRTAIHDLGVYPRAVQDPLPVWIGTGGNANSAIRAGLLGLPVCFAIIGGSPARFASLVNLYKEAAKQAGHDLRKLKIAVHSHGFIKEDAEEAANLYFPAVVDLINVIGRERGFAEYTRQSFEAARSLEGALYLGDPEHVAEKIVLLKKNLGLTRFLLHIDISTLPHRDLMQTIELFGTKVVPMVKKELARIS